MSAFNITTGTDGLAVLSFDSDRTEECIKYALSHNIKRISLIDSYYHENLLPLLPLKNVLEGLILNDKVDFAALCQFRRLCYLGALDNGKNQIDLSCFPNLETLACNITIRLKALESCKMLKSLTVSRYNGVGNLRGLPPLHSLEHLSLIKTSVNELAGVELFSNLQRLELYCAPALKTIAALTSLTQLKELSIEACKKVTDYAALGRIDTLEKILLTNSGEIPSLAFIKSLLHLRFISFVGTNVRDGDISHCAGLEYVGFDDKRHYNRKMRDFQRQGV